MLFKYILFIALSTYVSSDVVDDVRKEEHNTYQSLLTKAGTAAIGYLFNTKFSDAERTDADNLYAISFPVGDVTRKLPENETSFEADYCRGHRDRGDKLLTYVRNRYAVHLISLIAIRLVIKGFNAQNDLYCNEHSARLNYVENAKVINSVQTKLHESRQRFIDSSIIAANATSTPKENVVPIICCAYWAYKNSSVATVPEPKTKQFIADQFHAYFGFAAHYLCIYHSEGSSQCANTVLAQLPPTYQRPQTNFVPIVEALARVTSLTIS